MEPVSGPEQMGSRWLRSDDETLISCHESGKAVSEMAVALGRTEGAIRARIGKLFLEPNGLPIPRFPSSKAALGAPVVGRIVKSHLQGIPVEDIAADVGLNVFAVADQLLEARVLEPVNLDEMSYPLERATDKPSQRSWKRWTTDEEENLSKQWDSGASLDEMIEQIQRGRWAILHRLYVLGKITDQSLDELLSHLRAMASKGKQESPERETENESKDETPPAQVSPIAPSPVPLPLPADPISSRKNDDEEPYRTDEQSHLRNLAQKYRWW
jgi:hypothetical protein